MRATLLLALLWGAAASPQAPCTKPKLRPVLPLQEAAQQDEMLALVLDRAADACAGDVLAACAQARKSCADMLSSVVEKSQKHDDSGYVRELRASHEGETYPVASALSASGAHVNPSCDAAPESLRRAAAERRALAQQHQEVVAAYQGFGPWLDAVYARCAAQGTAAEKRQKQEQEIAAAKAAAAAEAARKAEERARKDREAKEARRLEEQKKAEAAKAAAAAAAVAADAARRAEAARREKEELARRRAEEERKAKEEAARRAEEERREKEEQARRKVEEEKRAKEEAARRAEEERLDKEELARRKAEDAAQRAKEEEERRAEQAREAEERARKDAEDKARREAEQRAREEARQRAEQERERRVQEAAQRAAELRAQEEERRKQAEKEAAERAAAAEAARQKKLADLETARREEQARYEANKKAREEKEALEKAERRAEEEQERVEQVRREDEEHKKRMEEIDRLAKEAEAGVRAETVDDQEEAKRAEEARRREAEREIAVAGRDPDARLGGAAFVAGALGVLTSSTPNASAPVVGGGTAGFSHAFWFEPPAEGLSKGLELRAQGQVLASLGQEKLLRLQAFGEARVWLSRIALGAAIDWSKTSDPNRSVEVLGLGPSLSVAAFDTHEGRLVIGARWLPFPGNNWTLGAADLELSYGPFFLAASAGTLLPTGFHGSASVGGRYRW